VGGWVEEAVGSLLTGGASLPLYTGASVGPVSTFHVPPFFSITVPACRWKRLGKGEIALRNDDGIKLWRLLIGCT
jgi:hypothetical protein